MEIPYTVSARPDTGLYNAKLGIWLFLASEVMLFGGLFSAYIFMRLGAEPGRWPMGLLNVPVGTVNTVILIASSVTVVLAWAALKMRQYTKYWWYMLITIVCGVIFLGVKLSYEWPDKFHHFGVYIRKDRIEKYDEFLGNKWLAENKREPRYEIAGHLSALEIERNGVRETVDIHDPSEATKLAQQPGVKLLAYNLELDAVNADPTNVELQKPRFWPLARSNKEAKIAVEDVDSASAFYPRHNTYFATYFLITGLHGLHVLGGVIVFAYFFFTGRKLYRKNPEHLANRVEVAGLFWHFVDLVWIFVFPIFYLL